MSRWEKFLKRDRRRSPRYALSVGVNFYAWDATAKKPRTGKVPACLTAISLKGACLQTSRLQIEDYHLLLNHDPQGKTILVIDMPPSSEGDPWSVQAKVISYDKFPQKRQFQFDVRLQFMNLSKEEMNHLENLIKNTGVSKNREPSK